MSSTIKAWMSRECDLSSRPTVVKLYSTHTLGAPLSGSDLAYNNMGKVHGSLARAGKVKSQTPKVEKQEKKKTPKGRAKKRILYNRRFVNVTSLPGGKRRMNPNPEK
ncbi:ribosomal protein S30-domain-containing protein [Scleroderma yunnanense]